MAKILMISGDRSLAQGNRGAFYNTLSEFHKYWERIDIICPRVSSGQLAIVHQLFSNVYIHPSPWPLIFQPWFILRKGYSLFQKHGFQIMTVHEYPPFYNGLGARWLHGATKAPYILEIHHIPGYPKSANFKEKIYRKLSEFFLKYDASKARAVRVVNQNQLIAFLIRHGVAKEKIVYIPSLYIDLNIFKPTAEEKKYDLIFVGRLAENKGIDLFLEAVKISGLKAVIVGDGPLKENLKFKIKNLKLDDHVDLYGWAKDQAEVAQLINQSKILIMPSYNEGGPRVVLEAMACGTPVLATPVGIAADIIDNYRSGKIIDWNATDIAKKARELLTDGPNYHAYRNAGLEIARKFEKKAMIKNFASELKKIISK